MTTLYFKDGSSDKIYQVELVQSDATDGWNVQYSYGRRGSTMTTAFKNGLPISLEDARKLKEKLLREKMAKGYTEGTDGTAYKATNVEDRYTGILPMLLNPVTEDELVMYMTDPSWIIEQKYDGVRMMLRINPDGTVDAINRKGLLVGAPECILKEAATLKLGVSPIILDGECVGEHFYAFDYLCEYPLKDRKWRLTCYLNPKHEHIHEVWFADRAKYAYLERMRSENAEGIVLKDMNSMYRPGRPNKLGHALKYKFTQSVTCVVHQINTQRSVGISLWDVDYKLTSVGNVTILPNFPVPAVGEFVEVQYLYAYEGGSLYQPVYKGVRNDVGANTIADLKFKREDEDEQ